MALSPEQMKEAIIRNLREKTGKSLSDWLDILVAKKLNEKKEIVQFLKTEEKLDHFQAQVIFNEFRNRNK